MICTDVASQFGGKGESMAKWFYRSGSEEFGPVSSAEVRSLVKAGEIVTSTPIRKTDSEKWIKAERIKGLFDGIQPQPEEEEIDPLIAMTSQAVSSVASATSSAASTIGNAVSGWKDRRKERQAEAASATPDSDPSESDKFTLDDQPADVVMKVVEKVREILTQGEELTYVAIQNKPVVNWMPDCIALTDKRFIFYRPKVFGRIDFEDYVWRELHDAKLSEDIIGSTFTVTTAAGKKLSMNYLPKSQARAIYRIAQEIEEQSLEERRLRRLEEKRASAGGVVVQASIPQAAPTAPTPVENGDPMQRLRDLKSMADEGLISTEEFEAKKAEILSRM
jgi:hypothetical protein